LPKAENIYAYASKPLGKIREKNMHTYRSSNSNTEKYGKTKKNTNDRYC